MCPPAGYELDGAKSLLELLYEFAAHLLLHDEGQPATQART